MRYLRLNIKKNKENNDFFFLLTFDHIFKDIPLYVMNSISFERYYFVLYDSYGLVDFCEQTLQICFEYFGSKLCLNLNLSNKQGAIHGLFECVLCCAKL